MLNNFITDISETPLPEQFPSPFGAEPHPICIIAANELTLKIKEIRTWSTELNDGKMFGVLVVKARTGELGYLAAFSGNIEGSNNHSPFVPPVADILNPKGFFKQGEAKITAINREITKKEASEELHQLNSLLISKRIATNTAIATAKAKAKDAKLARDKRRQNLLSEDELASLIKESQHEKAEIKRLEKESALEISKIETIIKRIAEPIELLKAQRKQLSSELQMSLFEEFQMLNIRGEKKGLQEIFKDTTQRIPPAGAGECAGPKLLQYAFLNNLTPIAMAEFWWGRSPKAEVRHHGYFYPACKGKCEPILKHMLEGMNVAQHSSTTIKENRELDIIYEDEWLMVINKPEGMLSIPGKIKSESVVDLAQRMILNGSGPLAVHRLDMDTSGLLLIAKSKSIHQKLQQYFIDRKIKKRYIAIVEGLVDEDNGTIDLPLCLDPHDRPRQMVSFEHGKPSVTHFEVLSRSSTRTKIAFYPITGRTHQLRVHSAHQLGLGLPIVGDSLYGKKDRRLLLHAEWLQFPHPITDRIIEVEKKADF